MADKTAILFFARTPEEEASAKAWTASKSLNLRVAKQLYNRTSKVLAKSKLPVFTSNLSNQRGNNFSERITNALADFFKTGYKHAIVVGSDCADLSIHDIQNAEANLQNRRYTYGTSFDGGVYLFTLSNSDFDKEKLLALPWCTNNLSFALLQSIYDRSVFAITPLQRKGDLDSNLEQLRTFLQLASKFFQRLVLNIYSFCNPFVAKQKIIIHQFTSSLHNKGSPLY